MITTIIFDLGEVYLNGLRGVEHVLEPMLGIKADSIRPELVGTEANALFRGEISEEEYWKKLVERNKWKIGVDRLKKIVRENFREIEGTREIIEKLKKKGFKLGLLSIHAKEWIAHCSERFDYHKLFHSTL